MNLFTVGVLAFGGLLTFLLIGPYFLTKDRYGNVPAWFDAIRTLIGYPIICIVLVGIGYGLWAFFLFIVGATGEAWRGP